MSKMSEILRTTLQTYSPPTKRLSYGTAGFRDEWSKLHSSFLRMGILATLRSRSQWREESTDTTSLAVGIMITASHNPEKDNGLKMVDIDGGMLAQEWEPYAEKIANYQTADEVIQFIDELSASLRCSDSPYSGTVIIGRDTRPHSKELFNCVCQGVNAMGGRLFDVGEVTTPQLHFIVQKANEKVKRGISLGSFDPQLALQEYNHTLFSGFQALQNSSPTPPCTEIIIDGAYGVGALAIRSFVESLSPVDQHSLVIDLRNRVGDGPVNTGCGAEIVQKGQVPPHGVSSENDSGKLICSYDGDADRIVFHTFNAQGTWYLLDGDKIAALVSTFLINEIRAAGLFDPQSSGLSNGPFRMGVVQTAYANGASTAFLKSQGIEVAIAKTGVKYLHHVALQYDIGVYFEANGHGTVIFSDEFIQTVNSLRSLPIDPTWDEEKIQRVTRQNLAFSRLQSALLLINQAVGDAISDMLLCLVSLQVLDLSVQDWIGMYTDLCSRQTKVPATNKNMIICSEDETRALQPEGLQHDLDEAMASTPLGRCFVRPSGTEDYVRVYAEAASQQDADNLALLCVKAINTHVGITGEMPLSFH